MSTLKVGNLQHPDSNTVSIQLNSAGAIVANNNMSVVGNLTTTGMVVPSSSYLRNRIINGDMRIDQRNAGANVTQGLGLVYTVDRWAIDGSVTSKFTARGVDIGLAGFTKALLITSAASTTVGTNDYYYIRQAIEGFNTSDLYWGTAAAKPITLSFWVYSSLTGTFGGSLRNVNNTRSYPFTYTINSANAWEQKSITIAGETTGTWSTTNTSGIQLQFGMGVGSTYSGTAGSWAATNYISATGATSIVGTNGATFYITGVQLEEGTASTPFERRLYGQELAMCQRYYEVGDGELVCYGTTGGSIGVRASFKQTKRANPTVSISNVYMSNSTQNGTYDINVNGFFPVATVSASGMAQFWYSFTAASEL